MTDQIDEAIEDGVVGGYMVRCTINGEPGVRLTAKGRMREQLRRLAEMSLTPPREEHPEAWRAKRMREIKRDAGNLLSVLDLLP